MEKDSKHEHFKKIYPDTIKITLTTTKNFDKKLAQKQVEQIADMQQSKVLLWELYGKNIVIYSSVQFKADADKMVKGSKVKLNEGTKGNKHTYTVLSDGVVYCNGLASIEVDGHFGGLYEASKFKPIESEVEYEED